MVKQIANCCPVRNEESYGLIHGLFTAQSVVTAFYSVLFTAKDAWESLEEIVLIPDAIRDSNSLSYHSYVVIRNFPISFFSGHKFAFSIIANFIFFSLSSSNILIYPKRRSYLARHWQFQGQFFTSAKDLCERSRFELFLVCSSTCGSICTTYYVAWYVAW